MTALRAGKRGGRARRRIIAMLALAAAAAGATAGPAPREPLVGPWPLGDPTELLVLGTPHLSGIGHLQNAWLEPLLERLEQWRPQVITIEALSGPQCLLLRRYQASWRGTADSYCARTEALALLGAASTGLDLPAAEAAAEAAIAALGPRSTPAERRRTAGLFAAAGNPGSAAVQWLRLAPPQRKPGDGVDKPLAEALDQLVVRRNENVLLAAALAARLGLERVHPVDDHLSDRIQAEAPAGLAEAMTALWSGPRPAMVEHAVGLEKSLDGGAALLAYYRYLNRADVAAAFVRSDMGKAFAAASPERHGRRYVAWWESRNLAMAANVRAAIASRPGSRALVVVGSTHKPYLDSYLGQMHEVRIVPAGKLLGDADPVPDR